MDGFFTHLFFSVIILALIIVIASVKVGAWWLRLALIDVLAVMLVRRVNALGVFLGGDLISGTLNDFLTAIALLAIMGAFIAAWLRRKELGRIEKMRVNRLEQMRYSSEKASPWDYQNW
jgi:hypothetical protein